MNKELEKELNEMESMINADQQTSATEAPTTEHVVTSAPSTEAPGTEAPSTEAPGTEAPTTEVPVEEDELAKTKARLAELEAENKKLKTKPTTEAPATEMPVEEVDFFKEVDPYEVTQDAKKFNDLLNKVLKQGIAIGRKSDENIIRSMPEIVKKNIEVVKNLEKVSTEFYDKNKDLVPFKKVVAITFEEELSKNPDKSYEEVLEKMVAPSVRQKLDLHKKATSQPNQQQKQQQKPGDPKPRLPKSRSQQRQTQPETNSLLAELDEMDKTLNS